MSAQKINRAPTASAPTAAAQRTAKQPVAGPSTPKKRTELLPRSSPQGHPPSSPERPSTPEPDVDVGGTPEPEAVSYETARDGESDAIVRQLERGLPRWEGFADVGWAEDISMVSLRSTDRFCDGFKVCFSFQERATAIINAIKEFQDSKCETFLPVMRVKISQGVSSNIRLAAVIENLPEETAIPDLSFSVSAAKPLSRDYVNLPDLNISIRCHWI